MKLWALNTKASAIRWPLCVSLAVPCEAALASLRVLAHRLDALRADVLAHESTIFQHLDALNIGPELAIGLAV